MDHVICLDLIISPFKSIHTRNGICHMLVQFSIKAQKPHCIRTCKCRLLQKNLQLCYNVILNVELHCSTIIKLNNSFFIQSDIFSLFIFCVFSPLSSLNDSLSPSVLSPSLLLCLSISYSLFLLMCSGGLFVVDLGMARSRWWYFFSARSWRGEIGGSWQR